MIAGLVLAAAVGAKTVPAQAVAPPMAISIAWKGAPCQAQATIVATITNKSDHDLGLPTQPGGLGEPAQLFYGVIIAPDGTARGTIGGTPPPFPWDKWPDVQIITIKPGEATSYLIEISAWSAPHVPPHMEFEAAYQDALQHGGKIQLFYSWWVWEEVLKRTNLFVQGSGTEAPVIKSNTLECPARR